MLVLGIETSCDETGIALYDSREGLLADAVHSQVDLHADYGGVVPELASRDHVRKIVPLDLSTSTCMFLRNYAYIGLSLSFEITKSGACMSVSPVFA